MQPQTLATFPPASLGSHTKIPVGDGKTEALLTAAALILVSEIATEKWTEVCRRLRKTFDQRTHFGELSEIARRGGWSPDLPQNTPRISGLDTGADVPAFDEAWQNLEGGRPVGVPLPTPRRLDIERRILGFRVAQSGQIEEPADSEPRRVWKIRDTGARSIRLLFRRIEKYLRRILGIAHTPPVFRIEDDRDTSRVDHSHESHRSRAPGRSWTSVDLVRWEPALT